MTTDQVEVDFYGFKPLDSEGKPFDFEQLRGKVVLIVNVASHCGFTPQYKDLEYLHRKYNRKGLVILGFPCNQFGHQEPGSNYEISKFCTLNFGITFPILNKINVNGVYSDPLYKYLKERKLDSAGLKGIKWNFEKFLVSSEGEVYGRYSSLMSPLELESDISTLIEQNQTAHAT
ncbi:hypothetical protein TPHA_0N01060 [Tetrapisispora phaffii CBS 4417]|uniref:Glutathione peroxidase n=1 Tax=Tetrapisispora phaffii (strain ATCC 24235 / CBS 4417 / NBRC 1672 / NRRL Y-8282 / UCD 70-5) TaxID=1071381 RepID=G8C159_TETPH|nr:hypothetical protein TPHA_0N01060 [Tetrapisispora phaffii CBS 4417]CCE65887.1 hypothetical protein TPHA_0N01060 [Tetrapisispora phaffii CBS 4417]